MVVVEMEENNAQEKVVKRKRPKSKEPPVVDPNAMSQLVSGSVLQAVEVLHKVVEESKKKESNLIEENTPIQLQYNFKKIPQLKNKRLHARVPHTLVTDDTDVCLFVKDVHKGAEDQEDKRDFTPSVRHFKRIVEEAGVKKVEEIIPVIQLKREYHDFEMQRKLCDSFDLFLCDERISKFMPKLLGKTFHKKRKLPINVKLNGGPDVAAKSLRKALESVHGLITGQGSSTSVTVSHTGLTAQQTTENILAVVQHMVGVLPGGWKNISGLYVTTTKTTSIPLFVSTTSASSVQLPPDVVEKKVLVASGDPGLIGDEENDEDGEGIVHVFDDGTIKIGGDPEIKEEVVEGQDVKVKKEKQEGEGQKEPESEGKKKPEKKEKENVSDNQGENGAQRKRGKRGKKHGKSAKKANTGKKQAATPANRSKAGVAAKGDKGKTEQSNQSNQSPKKTKQNAQKKKQVNGDSPAAKKTKVASTKGPLSKKPRLA